MKRVNPVRKFECNSKPLHALLLSLFHQKWRFFFTNGVKILIIPLVIISFVSFGCSPPKERNETQVKAKAKPNPMQLMKIMLDSHSDKVNGGIYHAVSEEWSSVTDASKYCEDQFSLALTNVFQNMMTGNPVSRDNAKELVDLILEKLEDKTNGGFYKKATKDWQIEDKDKSLHLISSAFGTIMHLYEITFDDHYLLKCFDLLDLVLDKCWDKTHGGFFDSYNEDWTPNSNHKSLSTQMDIILHLAGAWKDGIDSPYAERAERYKQKSIEITKLTLEKMYDHKHGGFVKICNADWSVQDDTKDTEELTSAITTLFFIYHNLGPVIWGPRKGSHAYSPGRPINDSYSYLGPAPNPRPISMEAYNIGRIVVDTANLLVEKSWDPQKGGFYKSCTRDWRPADKNKSAKVQTDCLVALNIAYKLCGDIKLKDTLKKLQDVLKEKAQDTAHSGYYENYTFDWKPQDRQKLFSVNMGVFGALMMTGSTVRNPPLAPVKLKVWIEPQSRIVEEEEPAIYEIMVQNQGFSQEKVRIGGLMALSRWMDTREFHIDLEPHQIYTYTLKVKPPKGLRGNSYSFEVAAIAERYKKDYFSDIAFITIK